MPRDLLLPTLEILNATPGGWMSTADLIHNLTALIDPQGPQINMISHEEAGDNIVREGYAEYERGGLQITDAGRAFLKKRRE